MLPRAFYLARLTVVFRTRPMPQSYLDAPVVLRPGDFAEPGEACLYHVRMDARTWLARLPSTLAAQREVLVRLLREVEEDPRWRWLELSCSIAEGRGDALSDIDLGLGVAADVWDTVEADLPLLLESLAPTAAALYHHLPQMGAQAHIRAFVQYGNGVQLDLVAVPADAPRGYKPEDIILYDPDGLLGEPWDDNVLQATPALVYEWTFLGWVALADLTKYLRRDSCWEALERLDQVRTQIWRLWAVVNGVRYPGFGLTAVLDCAEVSLPPGIDRTTAHANGPEIRQAARTAADLLTETSRRAAELLGVCLPEELAGFVGRQLGHHEG